MLTRRNGIAMPARRRGRMPAAGRSSMIAAVFAVVSMAVVVIGGQTGAGASTSLGHGVTASVDNEVGHQPTNARTSISTDRGDTPHHRAVPWSPLAVGPDDDQLAHPEAFAVRIDWPSTPWRAYDVATEHGRSPPR